MTKSAIVRILPTLPRMRYVFTCPYCRCHAYTRLFMAGDASKPEFAIVCVNCLRGRTQIPD